MFRKLFAASLLAFVAEAAVGSYDYKKKGEDWTDLCATGKKQSPIDLSRSNDLSGRQKVVLNDKYPDLNNAIVVDKKFTINVH